MPPEPEVDDDAQPDDHGDDAPQEIQSRLERIEDGIARFGDFLAGRASPGVGPDDENDTDDAVTDVAEPAVTDTGVKSQRQTELDVEQSVRSALAKVRKEEETDQRISAVEEKVRERPPVKQSRLSRAWWGDANKVSS